MTEDDFNKLIPNGWADDVDYDGQIVIYTGLKWSDDGTVVPYEDDE